jgi:hypothetical protein
MASIPTGEAFTKEFRQKFTNVKGFNGGKKTSRMEKYQRHMTEQITGLQCPKSGHTRIDLERGQLTRIRTPIATYDSGLFYTEDFDGAQQVGTNTVYYNFKSIVGNGGSQTRSLREVAHFIKGQYDVLAASDTSDVYFVNILDGDVCENAMRCLRYASKNHPNIYVGNLHDFSTWFFRLFPR